MSLQMSIRLTIVALAWMTIGCSTSEQPPAPAPSPPGTVEVVGTLAAVKDDRPADGGVDLTLQTATGVRELVRVPSAFRPPPRDSILAMHAVVDSSKIGDRLRARGTRDESGAVLPQTLERVSATQ